MARPVLDSRLGVECAYGDPVTWREALDLLYGLLPDYVDTLRNALQTGDTATLHRAAHSLSGASSYCRTVAVQVAAKELEALCLRESGAALPDAVQAVLHHIDCLMQLKQSGTLPAADGEAIYE